MIECDVTDRNGSASFTMKRFYTTICLLLTFWGVLLFATEQARALVCTTPGKDGVNSTLTGTVNTYYPATASASSGNVSITLGSASGLTPIASGDLLLVIQMQDADINSTNTTAYGAG